MHYADVLYIFNDCAVTPTNPVSQTVREASKQSVLAVFDNDRLRAVTVVLSSNLQLMGDMSNSAFILTIHLF